MRTLAGIRVGGPVIRKKNTTTLALTIVAIGSFFAYVAYKSDPQPAPAQSGQVHRDRSAVGFTLSADWAELSGSAVPGGLFGLYQWPPERVTIGFSSG